MAAAWTHRHVALPVGRSVVWAGLHCKYATNRLGAHVQHLPSLHPFRTRDLHSVATHCMAVEAPQGSGDEGPAAPQLTFSAAASVLERLDGESGAVPVGTDDAASGREDHPGFTPPKPFTVASLSAEQLDRNQQLIERFRGNLILAPLTRGGTLPFRRLCVDFGAEVTMSEMAYARKLSKGDRAEKARLRKANNEGCFGVQIATNNVGEGVAAAKLAAEAGAAWLDLNCGCPIYEASRRGLGAVLLRNPRKLGRLVAGIAEGSPLPLTVKVRTGTSASDINLPKVVEALQLAGAAAVVVHGRTMEQRYKKPADWGLVGETASSYSVPIVGNGDILTHYEARKRLAESGCLAVMTGRGALVKPWIFEEIRTGRELSLSARERVQVYRQLVAYMREYFGDDSRGRGKAFYFLPWHFDFFHRYRAFPEEEFGAMSVEHPLMLRRWDSTNHEGVNANIDVPPLERLLRCGAEAAHLEIANVLWDSASDEEACNGLEALAKSDLAAWEEASRQGTCEHVGEG